MASAPLPSCLPPPPSPVWSTASALEELAFEHGGFPTGSVRYLNMFRSDRDSITGSGLEVPVTTGLLVLISGAASGNNLANIVQAVDSNKWPDEKRLIRVIKRTLEMVKTPAEKVRLVKSDNSADVAACMRRELKDPYVSMPKVKIGRAKKKINTDSAQAAGTGEEDGGNGGCPFDIDGGCGEFDFFGGGGIPNNFDGGDGGDGCDFFDGFEFSDVPHGSVARVGVGVDPFDVPAAALSKGGVLRRRRARSAPYSAPSPVLRRRRARSAPSSTVPSGTFLKEVAVLRRAAAVPQARVWLGGWQSCTSRWATRF